MALEIVKSLRDAVAPIFRPAGTLIEGVNPADWASPTQPIRPVGQLTNGVRTWDFTPGINLQFTPRGDVPVKFGQLYNVANAFDLCRLMIERRKNQIVNRAWTIRVKPKPGEHEKDRIKRESSTPDVQLLTQLFRCPDGVHTFDKWIRMWLEQMYVFDAASISPVFNRLGDVLWLRVVSGATITPLLDEHGFIPMPPQPAYQQIILGIPTGNLVANAPSSDKRSLTTDQLIYSPKNPRVDSRWGFGPVEQIITTLAIAANRQQFFLDFYRSGNVPEGLLPMPENWTPNQIKDFQNWFDSLLVGNLAKRRRMTMIPATGSARPVFPKTDALTDNTDEYLARVVAFAFGESPQALTKQVGHQSTAKEGNDQAQETGLEPDLKHIEVEMNRIIENVLKKPDVEFSYSDAREIDPLAQAKVDQIYVTTGTYTRNEVREARGDDPRPEPEADMLGLDTPSGFMPLGETAMSMMGDQQDPSAPPKGGKSTPVKVEKALVLKLRPTLTPNSSKWRQQMAHRTGRLLKQQAARVGRVAAAEFGKIAKGDLETDTDRALAILAAIKVWDYETFVEEMRPLLEAAGREGANAGAYQIAAQGAHLPDTLAGANAAAEQYAAERSAQVAGFDRVDGTLEEAAKPHWAISVTARQDVLKTIQQALREGWTPAQLDAVIQGSTLFSQDHADLIAQQETERAQAMGHYAAWRESRKVAKVQWRTSPLHICCDECDLYEAKGPVKVGHEFAMGVVAPPDAHPGCLCWLEVTEYTE